MAKKRKLSKSHLKALQRGRKKALKKRKGKKR